MLRSKHKDLPRPQGTINQGKYQHIYHAFPQPRPTTNEDTWPSNLPPQLQNRPRKLFMRQGDHVLRTTPTDNELRNSESQANIAFYLSEGCRQTYSL